MIQCLFKDHVRSIRDHGENGENLKVDIFAINSFISMQTGC